MDLIDCFWMIYHIDYCATLFTSGPEHSRKYLYSGMLVLSCLYYLSTTTFIFFQKFMLPTFYTFVSEWKEFFPSVLYRIIKFIVLKINRQLMMQAKLWVLCRKLPSWIARLAKVICIETVLKQISKKLAKTFQFDDNSILWKICWVGQTYEMIYYNL